MDISIIGSGNIAWHFARFFHQHGHRIVTIYNRTESRCRALAETVSAQFSSSFEALSSTAVDLVVIAVNDDAIAEVVQQIEPNRDALVIHTSGATAMAILSRFERHGVIYPPQSISKRIESSLADIPFAIEGSDEDVSQTLLKMMQSIAPKSFLCNSEQRLALHIGAVFVNNFSNALYQIAYEILEQSGLDFELLRPIILETAKKVQNDIPKAVQTGPAVRNDDKTIKAHLQFLSNNDTTKEIYQQLTTLLIKSRHKS